jgi:hypothetical protein
MKRVLFVVVVCAAALCGVTPAVIAADADGAYFSLRSESCREFRRVQTDERTPALMNIRGWIAGYITAFNRQTPDTYDVLGITEFDAALRFIDGYCKAHPLDNLATAMEALTENLYPARHRTRRQAGH